MAGPTIAVILVFVALATVWVGFALAARRERRGREHRVHVRLRCPVKLRMARVVFRLAPDGTRTDVLGCSLASGRLRTCGKACLPPAVRGSMRAV